jgi:hypothetical protein
MTACIAAACKEKVEGRDVVCIVGATDTKEQTTVASGEYLWKFRSIAYGWDAMIAGTVSSAEELVTEYERHLKTVKLTESNVAEELRRPAETIKRRLAEHYIKMQVGMSYDDFMTKGNKTLSPEDFREILYEVRKLSLGCQLLISGFINKKPKIFTVSEYGDVIIHQNFGAIGTGSTIAECALYQRQQHQHSPLWVTLYHVYEAIRLARIAPGVGTQAIIHVISQKEDGEVYGRFVNPKGDSELEKLYQKYSLQPLESFPIDGFWR